MAKLEQTSHICYRYYDLIMALFVAVLLISNIASSAKLVDWGVTLPVLNLPLAFDGGTLLFPISYIFGDVLTEVYGYSRSRRVIWTGFAMAALMVFTLWLVGKMPPEPTWQADVGQAAFDSVLGGVTHGGIILASLVAYFCRRVQQLLRAGTHEGLDTRSFALDPYHRLDTGGRRDRQHPCSW